MTVCLNSTQNSAVQQNRTNYSFKNRQTQPAFKGATAFYPTEEGFVEIFQKMFASITRGRNHDTSLPKVVQATRDSILEYLSMARSETDQLPANIVSAINIRPVKTKKGACYAYAIDHVMTDTHSVGGKAFINRAFYIDNYTAKIYTGAEKQMFDRPHKLIGEIKNQEEMREFISKSLTGTITNYLGIDNIVRGGVSDLRNITRPKVGTPYSRPVTCENISSEFAADDRARMLSGQSVFTPEAEELRKGIKGKKST